MVPLRRKEVGPVDQASLSDLYPVVDPESNRLLLCLGCPIVFLVDIGGFKGGRSCCCCAVEERREVRLEEGPSSHFGKSGRDVESLSKSTEEAPDSFEEGPNKGVPVPETVKGGVP
jgi:hypothetical protein